MAFHRTVQRYGNQTALWRSSRYNELSHPGAGRNPGRGGGCWLSSPAGIGARKLAALQMGSKSTTGLAKEFALMKAACDCPIVCKDNPRRSLIAGTL